MNSRPIEDALDPDLRTSAAALHRAALRAREVALQTGTVLVVADEGMVQALPSAQANSGKDSELLVRRPTSDLL